MGQGSELCNLCSHQILLLWIIAVPSPLEESRFSLLLWDRQGRMIPLILTMVAAPEAQGQLERLSSILQEQTHKPDPAMQPHSALEGPCALAIPEGW